MNAFLVFLHVVAAALWVGGMAFAHFCLRPAAFELLPPPQRVPLMVGALGRFFRLVAGAVVILWLTGLLRFGAAGAAVPVGWIAMTLIGLMMTLIFGWIVLRLYARARTASQAQRWPDAAAELNRIRILVSINLALGVSAIAAATLHR